MSTISSQEGVEVVKSISQERLSERMCEQVDVIEVPKISYQGYRCAQNPKKRTNFAAFGIGEDRCVLQDVHTRTMTGRLRGERQGEKGPSGAIRMLSWAPNGQ